KSTWRNLAASGPTGAKRHRLPNRGRLLNSSADPQLSCRTPRAMLDNNKIHVAQLRLRRQHRVVAGKQLNLRSARQADELRLLCRADVLNTSPARAADAPSDSRIWIWWWWGDRRFRSLSTHVH